MGMFSKITSGIGGLINDVTGVTSSAEQQYRNQSNLDAANRAWQEHMSNTAHQREVADLEAAGLNPILSGLGGSGASTPTGGIGNASAGTSGAGPVYDTAKELYKYLTSEKENKQTDTGVKKEEIKNAPVQRKLAQSQTAKNNSEAGLNEQQREWNKDHPTLYTIKQSLPIVGSLLDVAHFGLGINSAKNMNTLTKNNTARTYKSVGGK